MFTMTRIESIVVIATPAGSETVFVVMASNVTYRISGNKIMITFGRLKIISSLTEKKSANYYL